MLQSSGRTGKSRHRVYSQGAAVSLTFAALLGGLSLAFWPDTSQPPVVGPTIAAMLFAVDTPGINGAVKMHINPAVTGHAGGPSGLMSIQVGLDVPRGKTVRWRLDLGAVESSIRLRKMALPRQSALSMQEISSGDLITAPNDYRLPSPLGRVRDYVVVGEIRGPAYGYSQSSNQAGTISKGRISVTDISWRGPLPVQTKGQYARVAMPALTTETLTDTSEGFDLGWQPTGLARIRATEELDLPDYQVDAGPQASNGIQGWTWFSETKPGLVPGFGLGHSVSIESSIQRRTFIAGILVGLAASAFFGGMQMLLDASAERASG